MNEDYALNLNDDQIAELYATFGDWYDEDYGEESTNHDPLTNLEHWELQNMLYAYEDELVNAVGTTNNDYDDLMNGSYLNTDTVDIPYNEEHNYFENIQPDELQDILYGYDSIYDTDQNIVNNENELNQIGYGNRYFDLDVKNMRYSRKFNHKTTNYNLKFKNLPTEFQQLQDILYEAISYTLHYLFSSIKQTDYVRLVIDHESLQMPISFPYMRYGDLNVEDVMTAITLVSQSKRSLQLDSKLEITASTLVIPSGHGRKRHLYESHVLSKAKNTRLVTQLYAKSSVVKIDATDMCAFRSVVVGMAFIKSKKDPTFKNDYRALREAKSSRQTVEAFNLARAVGLDENKPCSLEEIKRIEDYIKDYQIIVISADMGFIPVYTGKEKTDKIFLLYNENHYDLITSVPGFYNKRNYCLKCYKAYNTYFDHKCNSFCKACKRKDCASSKSKIFCQRCKSKCNSDICLRYHMEEQCELINICPKCNRKQLYNHVCEGRWCFSCKKSVEWEHGCFILTETEKESRKKRDFDFKSAGFVFFDYECITDDGEHIPNLVVADKVCNNCVDCLDKNIQPNCTNGCGQRSFQNNDSFCKWLLDQHKFTCIAHNMRSYDGLFIIKYLLNNRLPDDKVNITLSGLKIMCLRINKIKIIDSFNFLPMALSKLPKTFNLNELAKGFFPHMFNNKQNQNKIFDKYPDAKYYGVDDMNVTKRQEFYEWYNLNCSKQFDLNKELLKYCQSDVDILKNACLTYRRLMLDMVDVDPFQKASTLPSVCHYVYRKLFMRPNTISIIPEYGLNPSQNHSIKQLLWLRYLSETTNTNIQHCINGKEKRIGKYFADGYCHETDTVYEFLGCYFHGCLKCYTPETFNSLLQKSMGTLNKEYVERKRFIESKVSKIIEIWEHEWDSIVKSDENVAKFIKEADYEPTLNPRDAVFGGRTNAAFLHYKCASDEEQIKYFDITSLYPFVQKYSKFPVGIPVCITENFKDINEYFGLIKCKILAPRNLYFPVLPARINNKLIFTLCAKCAHSNNQQDDCEHSIEERSFTGTWVSEEVKLALQHGYKVEKIYCVWNWSESEQYDKQRKSGGLFTEYINKFLKVKQESSGFPNWCQNEGDKQRYIDEYFEREGVLMDKEKIGYNEGLRCISKLMLNSFWGRYCMNTNKTKYKLVQEPAELYEFFISDQFKVVDLHNINEYMQVFYTETNEFHLGSADINVAIGAFTTAYGRIYLFKELHKINDRVLYYDTDSIIFVDKNDGSYIPPLGDFLGDFTNELNQKDGNYIKEFCSGGPKNYSYRTDIGKCFVKVKGLSLTYKTEAAINFDSIKRIVLENAEPIKVDQMNFKKDKKTWSIETVYNKKIYQRVYDKRKLLDDFSTLPFGY